MDMVTDSRSRLWTWLLIACQTRSTAVDHQFDHQTGCLNRNLPVDYGPFIKSQLARTQLTLRPYVVQIWSRYPPESGGGRSLDSPPSGCVFTRVFAPHPRPRENLRNQTLEGVPTNPRVFGSGGLAPNMTTHRAGGPPFSSVSLKWPVGAYALP
jgi:hypothetical protein